MTKVYLFVSGTEEPRIINLRTGIVLSINKKTYLRTQRIPKYSDQTRVNTVK